MEAFSDGVFSIAITLLVLEIGVPSGSGHDLLRALADQWPSYLAYLVSFATIGAVWFAHNGVSSHQWICLSTKSFATRQYVRGRSDDGHRNDSGRKAMQPWQFGLAEAPM